MESLSLVQQVVVALLGAYGPVQAAVALGQGVWPGALVETVSSEASNLKRFSPLETALSFPDCRPGWRTVFHRRR